MKKRAYKSVRAPEFLEALAAHAAQELKQDGLDDATAVELGQKIAARVARLYGGTWLRIPTGTWNGGKLCFELSSRDFAIYRAFNGQNRAQICRDYDICERQLYYIIQKVRTRLRQDGARPALTRIVSPTNREPESLELTPARRVG